MRCYKKTLKRDFDFGYIFEKAYDHFLVYRLGTIVEDFQPKAKLAKLSVSGWFSMTFALLASITRTSSCSASPHLLYFL
jgi:hypothetical protein